MSFLTGFQNRVALITGGSRGIGRATALLLAHLGAKVAVNYLTNQDAAQHTLHDIEQHGGHAIPLQGDVTQEDQATTLIQSTQHHLGPLDILVNSAGTLSRHPFEDIPSDEWNRILAVNLTGTFLVCRAA